MDVIDLHCDALLKLQLAKGQLSFTDSPELDVNLVKLKKGKVKIQAFAIYIDTEVPVEEKYQCALEQVAYYKQEVVAKHPEIKQITAWSDIAKLKPDEIGTFLTLEGVEAIGNDLAKLEHLLDEGVLSVGLTWNPANLAADGIGEPRGGGLTEFGYEIVELLNQRKVFTDVSHLSIAGFYQVLETANYPIASHSNAYAICPHRRNLNDEQIKKMVEKKAMIHVVYNPPFTNEPESTQATLADLEKHVAHFVQLGAIELIGFGSDFDGIRHHITDLTNSGQSQNLVQRLLNHYSTKEVAGFAYQNFMNHLPK